MTENYKQIIILRKDLNMRKGKMVAQGAHASMAAVLSLGQFSEDKESFTIKKDDRLWPWLMGKFKKITVSVDSEQELIEIYNKARKQGLISSLILDSGLTEFGGKPTYTSVAIGPDLAEKIDSLTSELKLL